MSDEWQPMQTFPQDGTRCDVLVTDEKGIVREVAREIFWGQSPIGRDRGLRGLHNMLSAYLRPLGWRLHQPLNEVPIKQGEQIEVRKITI